MQYMQQVQQAGLDPDDPLSSYMLQASLSPGGTQAGAAPSLVCACVHAACSLQNSCPDWRAS